MSSQPLALTQTLTSVAINNFIFRSDPPDGVPPPTSIPYRPPGWSKGPQKTSVTEVIPQQADVQTNPFILGTPPNQSPFLLGGSDQPAMTLPGNPSVATTYFFDAVLAADHYTSLRITEHPVQIGASIVDHAYAVPARIVLEVLMSDVLDSFIHGQYATDASKSVSAYRTFKAIQARRLPLTLNTHLDTYENMLIEDVRATDTNETVAGARMTVVFRQIIMATIATATVSSRPDRTDTTNEGTIQPLAVDQSILDNHTLEGSQTPIPTIGGTTGPTGPKTWSSDVFVPHVHQNLDIR